MKDSVGACICALVMVVVIIIAISVAQKTSSKAQLRECAKRHNVYACELVAVPVTPPSER